MSLTLNPSVLTVYSGRYPSQPKRSRWSRRSFDLVIKAYRAIQGNQQEQRLPDCGPLDGGSCAAPAAPTKRSGCIALFWPTSRHRGRMLTAMQIAADSEDMPAALSLLDRFAKKSVAGSTGHQRRHGATACSLPPPYSGSPRTRQWRPAACSTLQRPLHDLSRSVGQTSRRKPGWLLLHQAASQEQQDRRS